MRIVICIRKISLITAFLIVLTACSGSTKIIHNAERTAISKADNGNQSNENFKTPVQEPASKSSKDTTMPTSPELAGKFSVNAAAAKDGWAKWTKWEKPNFSGQYGFGGDPSVIKDGDIYRMFYTGFDLVKQGCVICAATSRDGFTWQLVQNGNTTTGKVLEPRKGEWDITHETCFALKSKDQYLLYFCGYKDRGGALNSFPAYLGLAYSKDGVDFTKREDEPIMFTTQQGFDTHAIFSPSIVFDKGTYYMVYTGWGNSENGQLCTYICGATSKNGKVWMKEDRPVLQQKDIPWAKDGAGEPELILGSDGYWYLFFTILNGDEPHNLGIARSKNPFGPWEVDPDPILIPTPGTFDAGGIVAPSVIIENDTARMWYSGFDKDGKMIVIGYAEAKLPLKSN